jgi:methyl-accepting chemotaxis protein
MLSRLSIRSKIIMVVAFLLLAMTSMGLLAARDMRAINANVVDIAMNWLPSVRVLGDLRAGVITYRNVIRDHMLGETIEKKDTAERVLQGIVENNDKIRQRYEPMIASQEERALYNDWSRTWNTYKKGTQEVMALSRKDPGHFPREALELNTNTVGKIAVDADEILKKDIDLNNAGAAKAAADAADNYNSAFLTLAIILGVAIVGGVVVSFYMIRDVSNGIASIVKQMQALGQGDLSVEILHRGEKTEIGLMADALQVFKEALIAKKASDEAAAKDAEAKIERGHRVDNITQEFEQMIGEIVSTVSSASPARSLRRQLVRHRRAFEGAVDHGCRCVGRSLHQRAVGRLRHRGAVVLGQ